VKRQKYFFRTKFAHFSRPAETNPYVTTFNNWPVKDYIKDSFIQATVALTSWSSARRRFSVSFIFWTCYNLFPFPNASHFFTMVRDSDRLWAPELYRGDPNLHWRHHRGHWMQEVHLRRTLLCAPWLLWRALIKDLLSFHIFGCLFHKYDCFLVILYHFACHTILLVTHRAGIHWIHFRQKN